MKKLSLSKRIEKYLEKRYPDFVHSGEIERLALQAGYKSSNAGRRCREMQNEGILERKLENGSVLYRYLKPDVVKYNNEIYPKKMRLPSFPNNNQIIPKMSTLW